MATQEQILSDHEIIELYWQRNENAIVQTDLKYHGFLMNVAQMILHNLQDSEECLNDTYLRTWNVIPPTRPTMLRAFLATIMRRCAIDVYRKNTNSSQVPQGLAVSFDDVGDILIGGGDAYTEESCKQLACVIDRYLANLPSRTRYVFISRYYFAMPVKQIARQLDCGVATVHREIAQIKCSLAEYLKKEGYTL